MVPYRTRLADSTASEESFEQALRWYRNCTDNHKRCSDASSVSKFLPSRLIEIESLLDGDHKIRLRAREDLQHPVPAYASLSHRWGRYMPFKLTTGNLSTCWESIPFKSISKVFQDAISLAFRFDLRYIWIDSLCCFCPDAAFRTRSDLLGVLQLATVRSLP